MSPARNFSIYIVFHSVPNNTYTYPLQLARWTGNEHVRFRKLNDFRPVMNELQRDWLARYGVRGFETRIQRCWLEIVLKRDRLKAA